MRSRIHPAYKTKYRVANWASYDRALVRRGDVTVWLSLEAIATWEPARVGTRGGQPKYSHLAIETALTLRLLFHLPLRQTEGFLTSVFGIMGLDLSVPDHTTLSRRGQSLALGLRRVRTGKRLHLVVDSTGLSIVGEGEWAAAKHGGRGKRGWKKLHLGLDRSGHIIAHALTDAIVDDALTGIALIEGITGAVASLTADAAYDTIAFYTSRRRTWCAGRGAASQDRHGVRTGTALAGSRSDDSDGDENRPTTMEEGIGLPSAGSRGERLLPVQVDLRRYSSSSQSRRAGGRDTKAILRESCD